MYDIQNKASRTLYTPESFMEEVVGWLDADTAITVSHQFESNPHSPRHVNVATGEVVLLDESSFGGAEFDPSTGTFLWSHTPVFGSLSGFVSDKFTAIDVRTLEKTTFAIPESEGWFRWSDAFQLFMTETGEDYTLFDADGTVRMTLPPGDPNRLPLLSPDGLNVAVNSNDIWDIYAPDGALRANLNLSGTVRWLPDGRLLRIFTNEQIRQISLHSASNDWRIEPGSHTIKSATSITLILP